MRSVLVSASAVVMALSVSLPLVAAEEPSSKPALSEFDKNAEFYHKSLVKDGYRFACRVHDENGKCTKLQWKKL
ncbi:hypothetical protein [Agarivorans sp. 1_MG-2023]|uniref:hypothetical protein n=1 Tax=Agarivorans sp. 1_MG-2023 TaxID=3062634 RepID=UPI0026E1845F|nr:hypothetical protein [Agarivorans sp. 1_MG-2023]MDO6762578.1 hypothetical protein [Agarivorans sp. 1_MG-2023]